MSATCAGPVLLLALWRDVILAKGPTMTLPKFRAYRPIFVPALARAFTRH